MSLQVFCSGIIEQLNTYAATIPDSYQRAAVTKNLEARPKVLEWVRLSATNPMLPAITVLRLLAGAVIPGDKVINEQARNVRFPEYNPVHNNSIANHFEAFVRIASQFDLPRQDWVVLILATFKGGSALDLATQWILIQPQDQLMDFEDFRRVLVEQVDGRNLISDTSTF